MWKWGLTAIGLLGLATFLALGREMYLVPGEGAVIVADIDMRNTADPSRTLAVLPAAQPVPILECRNFKDDQVYRVRTQTGIEGYVVAPSFRVEIRSWWDSLGGDRVICY
jgi:hypothetical protein